MTRCPILRKARRADPSDAKKEERRTAESANYIVAIDFGTTFSGAAFAKLTDVQSKGSNGDDGIQLHDNWPGQAAAGAKVYCKTQTSVWYMPGSKAGTFDLKGWGWSGYLGYIENARREGLIMKKSGEPRLHSRSVSQVPQKCGHLLKNFKLGLADVSQDLPLGLTLERVISDYLRELSTYVLKLLQNKYGSDAKLQREVQYVFTVPAMWSPKMRQRMKDCAEMAGMVLGLFCKDNTVASLHDLIVVTEPEAASVQVHKSLETANFMNGDRFMVVDVGGGTTDVISHEKIGSTTRSNYIRVKEVSDSRGALVGGTHVDDGFFSYLRGKIGCFSSFEKTNPTQIFEISRWWNDIKRSFNDRETLHLPLPGKLSSAWKRFDKKHNIGDQADYYYLHIDSQDIKSFFDPVVHKILALVHRLLDPDLRAILVVGGFSESPYLQRRMKEAFNQKTKTIFMSNAGSAILRGAALHGVEKGWKDMVVTRIAGRTIGFDTSWPFIQRKHRKEYMVIDRENDRLCDNIFGILIKRGQEIPVNYVRKVILTPMYRKGEESDGDDIEVSLYETLAKNPVYVTDKGVKKLSTCCISVPRKEEIGRSPQLELSLHFGTLIKASVEGKNFSGRRVCMPSVEMKWVKSFDAI